MKQKFSLILSFLLIATGLLLQPSLAEKEPGISEIKVGVYTYFDPSKPIEPDTFVPPWAMEVNGQKQVLNPFYFRQKDGGEPIYCLDNGKKIPSLIRENAKDPFIDNEKIRAILYNGFPLKKGSDYGVSDQELEWATSVALYLADRKVYDKDGNEKPFEFKRTDFNTTIFPTYSEYTFSKDELMAFFNIPKEDYVREKFDTILGTSGKIKKAGKILTQRNNKNLKLSEEDKEKMQGVANFLQDIGGSITEEDADTEMTNLREALLTRFNQEYTEKITKEAVKAENIRQLIIQLLDSDVDQAVFDIGIDASKAKFEDNQGYHLYGPISFNFPVTPDFSMQIESLNDNFSFSNADYEAVYGIDADKFGEKYYIKRRIDGVQNEDTASFIFKIKGSSKIFNARAATGIAPSGSLDKEYQRMLLSTDSITKSFAVDFPKFVPKGDLAVYKVDALDPTKFLPGAVFVLTDAGGKSIELDLGEDGIYKTDSLAFAAGEYTLQEKVAPVGYEKDSRKIPITIPYGATHQITVPNNRKEAVLVIEKKDAITKEPLAGAVFDILDKNGTLIEKTGETDKSGRVTVSLLYGSYDIKESIAPAGYVGDKNVISLQMDQDKKLLTVYNEAKKNAVVFSKVDAETMEPIAGAVIEVLDEKGKVIQTLTTNTDGKTSEASLSRGKYQYREKEAPVGYQKDSGTYSFEVKLDGSISGSLVLKNHKKKNSVVLTKEDKETKEPLEGAVFVIINAAGKEVFQGKTDKNGKTPEVLLTKGNYAFYEKEAPKGYILDKDRYFFEIDASGNISGTTTLENEKKKYPVVISKLDKESKDGLEGAEFEIYKKEKGRDTLVGKYRSGRNGKTPEVRLPFGSYFYKEIEAPTGYIKEEKEISFEISSDGKISGDLELLNTKTKFKIKKVDDKGNVLSGAKIEILDRNGKSLFKGTTNTSGELLVGGLLPGNYEAVEVEAPKGYLLSKEKLSIRIDEKGNVSGELKMVNKKSRVEIVKKDHEGKLLSGAVIKIMDASGKELRQATSDQNGKFVIEGLESGNYTYKEVTAPTGYVLSKKSYAFALNEDGQVIGDTELYNYKEGQKQEDPQKPSSPEYKVENPGITPISSEGTPLGNMLPNIEAGAAPIPVIQRMAVSGETPSNAEETDLHDEDIPQSPISVNPEEDEEPKQYEGEVVKTIDLSQRENVGMIFIIFGLAVFGFYCYSNLKKKK